MKPVILIKSKLPVLEYSAGPTTPRKSPKWGFRFRTAQGAILIQSPLAFRSKSEAERAFLSLIKFVATNQYTVECPKPPASLPVSSLRMNGRAHGVKARSRAASAFANSVSTSRRCLDGRRLP